MTTKLQPEQELERQVTIHGVEGAVIVGISTQGIRLHVKGSKKYVMASWTQVANACNTPGNVPSFLMSKPLEFLKHAAMKAAESRANRAERDEKIAGETAGE